MDVITIGGTKDILTQGQTTREITKNRLAEDSKPTNGTSEASGNFASTLKNAVDNVNKAQMEADRKMQELATGKSQNIHETMIAVEKADIALRLMVQVRNKVIEAYQEIMRMQV